MNDGIGTFPQLYLMVDNIATISPVCKTAMDKVRTMIQYQEGMLNETFSGHKPEDSERIVSAWVHWLNDKGGLDDFGLVPDMSDAGLLSDLFLHTLCSVRGLTDGLCKTNQMYVRHLLAPMLDYIGNRMLEGYFDKWVGILEYQRNDPLKPEIIQMWVSGYDPKDKRYPYIRLIKQPHTHNNPVMVPYYRLEDSNLPMEGNIDRGAYELRAIINKITLQKWFPEWAS